MSATDLIKKYYDAFNNGDMERFFSLLSDNVVHDVNQGKRQEGKEAFADFMEDMNECYEERVEDLVVMSEPSGRRAAAEFTIVGTYKRSQPGLPPAHGQTYRIPVGAFFEIEKGKVKRVTNYYNLNDWVTQVGGMQ